MIYYVIIALIIQTNVINCFKLEYEWSKVNFTWRSMSQYQLAIKSKAYIPENNLIAGIKVYKNNIYLMNPRVKPGTPVTLSYIPKSSNKMNSLLTPFPSWEANVQESCATLQNVQGIEIDLDGIMWVLDGTRLNNLTACPCKLVLYDLEKGGRMIHSYTFDNDVALTQGGFLNDLVIEETDGKWAYITDASFIDPGLIIYSHKLNKAWKLRDATMFGKKQATNFYVNQYKVTIVGNIDGIALSPPLINCNERTLFYSNLIGYELYSVTNTVLKDFALYRSGVWRQSVQKLGAKQGNSDGMYCDNQGNLYYTLIGLYAIGRWNINQSFQIIAQNRNEMIWPDAFGMDQFGFIYVLANNYEKWLDPKYIPSINDGVQFRIFKKFTGTRSYFYTK